MKPIVDLMKTLTWDELCAERNAIGLCMWLNCNEPLEPGTQRCKEDNERNNRILQLQQEGYSSREIMKRMFAPAINIVECSILNCHEKRCKDGLCADHYNGQLALEQEKPKLSPAKIKEYKDRAKELDAVAVEEMIDIDWWFKIYGEEVKPATFMNRHYLILRGWDEKEHGEPPKYLVGLGVLSKSEAMLLNESLKELDGTEINGGTHVWRFMGKKHFEREGQRNHFACVPID